MKQNLNVQFIVYFIVGVVYSFVIPTFLFNIIGCDGMPQVAEFENLSVVEELMMMVLEAFSETIIFSTIVILGLNLIPFLQNKQKLLIFASAIPFAISHYYCAGYVLITFFMGLAFNFYYMNIRNKTNTHSRAIIYVSSLHFLINFTVFILGKYFFIE